MIDKGDDERDDDTVVLYVATSVRPASPSDYPLFSARRRAIINPATLRHRFH
jgi:hypothetical protein